MPKAWMRERKRDFYYRKAKEEKYRSRAAYKLLQAAQKYGFIKPRDVVLDLGAAPGGWLQASLKMVGSRGFVLGVDLESIEPFESRNVHTIVGDVRQPEIVHTIKELLPREADVVVSDVSPNVSGIWELDHARQIDLAQKSLEIVTEVLKFNGNFFVKVFQGDMLDAFIKQMKRHFATVRVIKPKASRAKSAEMYVLGMGFRRLSS